LFALVLAICPAAHATTTVSAAAAGPSAPAVTTPATAWADSVRNRLAAQAVAAPAADAPAAQAAVTPTTRAAYAHPVTSWARSVEARLAMHAHRVALAGRSALAWSESGMASWYGGDHAGHRTSSGDRFDPMQLTCAHPTLPLGTKVLVTSDTTGRSVVVTVNDRGPFGGRIVDLSRAAAARIGMLGSGTASVTLQQASPEVVEVAQAAENDTSDEAIAAAGR
jgi:rare lipoprotein A